MSESEKTAQTGETPKYKVLEPCFIEPHFLYADSVIETWGPPGPHLRPLNEAAKLAMEKWYAEEHDEVDKDGKKTGTKIKLHEKYRFLTPSENDSERHEMTLIRGPRKLGKDMSLAESLAAGGAASFNQRPPPAPFLDDEADGPSIGDVTIAHAAPRPAVKSPAARS